MAVKRIVHEDQSQREAPLGMVADNLEPRQGSAERALCVNRGTGLGALCN